MKTGRAMLRIAATSLVVAACVVEAACGGSSAPRATPSPPPSVAAIASGSASVQPVGTAAVVTPLSSPTPYELPTVVASPASGAVGSSVHLEGDGFTDPMWQGYAHQTGGYGILLTAAFPLEQGSCDFIAISDTYTIDITPGGHLEATFTVPADGGCFQTEVQKPVVPGKYSIGIGCHVCWVGTFTVQGLR